jgi:hypothetical protein
MKRVIVVLLIIMGYSFAVAADNTGRGSVSGKIVLKDSGPMVDGTVLFFDDSTGPPPLEDQYMRVPDRIAGTDSRGGFSAELPSGKYYIGVKKHRQKKWNGPPRGGDLFFIKKDGKNDPMLHIVKAGEKLNMNIAAEDKPYEWPVARHGITGIEGIINDLNGNPVEDVVVFGYLKPAMDGGLVFVSDYTDSNGKYLLRVDEGGKYYLMVMGEFGTLSTVSGMMINYGAEADEEGIDVTTGEIISNVDISIKIP